MRTGIDILVLGLQINFNDFGLSIHLRNDWSLKSHGMKPTIPIGIVVSRFFRIASET